MPKGVQLCTYIHAHASRHKAMENLDELQIAESLQGIGPFYKKQ